MNPVPTEQSGYRKHIKLILIGQFTHLLEVGMKFIHRELSNLIEQFECTIVQELQNDYISIPVHQLITPAHMVIPHMHADSV